jgi:hypothetical protein
MPCCDSSANQHATKHAQALVLSKTTSIFKIGASAAAIPADSPDKAIEQGTGHPHDGVVDSRDSKVYHFSPACNSTRQRVSGVVRTEGKLLHLALCEVLTKS